MKISFTLLYVVGVLVIKNSVSGKTLIFNKYSNGPHFDIQKRSDKVFDDSKENSGKDSEESIVNSYKRSVDEINLQPLKRTFYDDTIRKRSPFGLVYNQGKPIGILEPIPQSFEYSAYIPRENSYRNSLYKSQWYPVKRESDADMDEMEKDQLESQTSALHSSNYAHVLAKFKVNNKVKHRPYQDYLSNTPVKRATAQQISRRKEVEDLKKRGAVDMGNLQANMKGKTKESTMTDDSADKVDMDKVEEIEENLKDVMGDMGLVEKNKEAEAAQANDGSVKKREIFFEDEDLENGLNKIGLTKESHYDRNKKEDCPGKTKVAKSKGSKKYAMEKSLHKKGKKKVRKDDDLNSKRSITNKKRAEKKMDISSVDFAKKKVANYQYEGEEFIRKKRQGKQTEKVDDSEIMRGLEASGDLTVSGNKSPLVAVSSEDDPELKKNQEKRDKEELEYEKRLERNIQAKINSIKEEVKREISKLKSDETENNQQRKKRNVISNTLLDAETSVLDPRVNIDHKLEPHIRKRRDLDDGLDAAGEEETKLKREAQTNIDDAMKDNTKTDVTANKMIRETGSDDSVENKVNVKPSSEAIEKVKRSDDTIRDVKKNSDIDKVTEVAASVGKREDKAIGSNEENVSDEKRQSEPIKRNSDEPITNIGSANFPVVNKNIEKRSDAFIATDRIETDTKVEFGTDAPESIVKRSDKLPSLGDKKVGTIFSEAANVEKRNDDLSEGTTDKCVDSALVSKGGNSKSASRSNMVEDRSVNEISDLETGQTILKDIDLESANEDREQRQSTKNHGTDSNVKTASADLVDLDAQQGQEEETREERSAVASKTNSEQNIQKQDKSAVMTHKGLRRNIEKDRSKRGLIKQGVANDAMGSSNDLASENTREENQSPINEEVKESGIKQRDVQSEIRDASDEVVVEERSVDKQQEEGDLVDDTINVRSAARHNVSTACTDGEVVDSDTIQAAKRSANKPVMSELQSVGSDGSFNDEMSDETADSAVEKRRKRRASKKSKRNRRKRDETSYSENKPELIHYRADNDGEIDDEGDEMHDDGFDDQTSNFMSKRQADYESEDYGTNEEQDSNEEYPMFMERNKRNALRLYDDENDAEESYDNFLFYPNRYSRKKRHNHGGGMTNHAAARRERNMQPYEQNMRRKRLEKLNRMHDQNENVAELSESDIFGGFPQSYEGELSRFKRVKRSTSE